MTIVINRSRTPPRFEWRDRRQPQVLLGHELQLHLIELLKADRLGLGDVASAGLSAWIAFLEHWQEETCMATLDYPPVRQALERLKELSGDEETRRLAMVRERALHDEVSELNAARREGREGRQEGRLEGEIAVLERQLTRRFGPLDEATRARLQGATQEQLEQWADGILDAPSLAALFD